MEGIDIVFHLAAAQHEMNIPTKFWDVNVGGREWRQAASNPGASRSREHDRGLRSGMNGTIDGVPVEAGQHLWSDEARGGKGRSLVQGKTSSGDHPHTRNLRAGGRRLLKLFRTINKFFS
jgi:hypothetical protein